MDLVLESTTAGLTLSGKDFDAFTNTTSDTGNVDALAVGGAHGGQGTVSTARFTDSGFGDADTFSAEMEPGRGVVTRGLEIADRGKAPETAAIFTETDHRMTLDGDGDGFLLFSDLTLLNGRRDDTFAIGTDDSAVDSAEQITLAANGERGGTTALIFQTGTDGFAHSNVLVVIENALSVGPAMDRDKETGAAKFLGTNDTWEEGGGEGDDSRDEHGEESKRLHYK